MNISIIGLFPYVFNKKYNKLAKKISKRYKVYDALNWPPHISIGKGYNDIKASKVPKLIDDYKRLVKNSNSVNIKIEDFIFTDKAKLTSTIRSQYAAVLKVKKSNELIELDKKLRSFTPSSTVNINYTPHITLAYNDLNKDKYLQIKEFLSDKTFIEETFIKSIALTDNQGLGYKREILEEIPLS